MNALPKGLVNGTPEDVARMLGRSNLHPQSSALELSKPLKKSTRPRAVVDVDEVSGLSEDALALIFERRHEDGLRYCHTTGAWFVWTGTRWKVEKTGLAFNWAREICREMGGGKEKFSKANTAKSVERFAQAARCFAVTSEIWDTNHWLIGTPGGTLNLKTGDVDQAKPDEHITRQAGCAPAPAGVLPTRWLSFLDDATRGDDGLVRFLQQIAGYALTGDTTAQALFFIYGAGGNGKSVFVNTLAGILGEYATTAPMDTFSASQHDKHTTDLAMLKGARLVTASETEEGRAWAEQRIKNMTGNEPITARFMRRDNFTYRPEFKLVIVGNHKPRLANVDPAIKRRFNIIPFTHKPTNPDRGLEDALRAEWPAIFRWMVEGCIDWQKNGFVPPEVVLEATEEYFEDQDVFSQWLEDCTDIGANFSDSNKSLFDSWKKYAEAAGERVGTSKMLSEKLAKRPEFIRRKSGDSRGFYGLRVKPYATIHDPRFPD